MSMPTASSSSSYIATKTARARASHRLRSRRREVRSFGRQSASSSSASLKRRRPSRGSSGTDAADATTPVASRGTSTVRPRRGATTTRSATPRDDRNDGEGGRRRKGSFGPPRPDPPALEDVLLLLGDCTVLWLYALFKKVSAVSAMPDFPGWLAPIDVSAQSAAAFVVECVWTLSLWVAVSAFGDAYKIDNFKTPTVKDAAVETVNAWVIWAPLQAMGAVMAMKSGLGQAASHGLLVSEVTALGVLLGWRCYAKVFSLLGPSRNADNAGRDDEEWGEFYRMFSGVAIICISCAMVEMIVYHGADL